MERLRDMVQISFFDLLVKPKPVKEEWNCYRCVFWESHRCINNRTCPEGMSFIEYTGSTVKQCILATIEVYQDGYIHCPVLNYYGCEKCMEEMNRDGYKFVRYSDQNYERKPRG